MQSCTHEELATIPVEPPEHTPQSSIDAVPFNSLLQSKAPIWIMISVVPSVVEPSFAVAFTVTVPFVEAVSKPFASILAEPVPLVTDHVTL